MFFTDNWVFQQQCQSLAPRVSAFNRCARQCKVWRILLWFELQLQYLGGVSCTLHVTCLPWIESCLPICVCPFWAIQLSNPSQSTKKSSCEDHRKTSTKTTTCCCNFLNDCFALLPVVIACCNVPISNPMSKTGGRPDPTLPATVLRKTPCIHGLRNSAVVHRKRFIGGEIYGNMLCSGIPTFRFLFLSFRSSYRMVRLCWVSPTEHNMKLHVFSSRHRISFLEQLEGDKPTIRITAKVLVEKNVARSGITRPLDPNILEQLVFHLTICSILVRNWVRLKWNSLIRIRTHIIFNL